MVRPGRTARANAEGNVNVTFFALFFFRTLTDNHLGRRTWGDKVVQLELWLHNVLALALTLTNETLYAHQSSVAGPNKKGIFQVERERVFPIVFGFLI